MAQNKRLSIKYLRDSEVSYQTVPALIDVTTINAGTVSSLNTTLTDNLPDSIVVAALASYKKENDQNEYHVKMRSTGSLRHGVAQTLVMQGSEPNEVIDLLSGYVTAGQFGYNDPDSPVSLVKKTRYATESSTGKVTWQDDKPANTVYYSADFFVPQLNIDKVADKFGITKKDHVTTISSTKSGTVLTYNTQIRLGQNILLEANAESTDESNHLLIPYKSSIEFKNGNITLNANNVIIKLGNNTYSLSQILGALKTGGLNIEDQFVVTDEDDVPSSDTEITPPGEGPDHESQGATH